MRRAHEKSKGGKRGEKREQMRRVEKERIKEKRSREVECECSEGVCASFITAVRRLGGSRMNVQY